ncbi:MAG: VOC family protein [Caulobacterales bacterium]
MNLQPMQLGYVVDNIDAAIRYWTKVIGAGPFFVFEAGEWSKLYHKGKPTDVKMRLSIGQWNNLQIELIEQLNDAPSPYLDFRAQNLRGLHHIGVLVDDLDADVAEFTKRGKPPVYHGATPQGFRFAYLVDDEHPGAMIELIERGPASNALVALVADAAKNWDGSNPVRTV